MVIYFHEDLRARSRIDRRGRVFWNYENAETRGKVRKWYQSKEITAAEFEASFSGPPPNQGDRDFRHSPQQVGLCAT